MRRVRNLLVTMIGVIAALEVLWWHSVCGGNNEVTECNCGACGWEADDVD